MLHLCLHIRLTDPCKLLLFKERYFFLNSVNQSKRQAIFDFDEFFDMLFNFLYPKSILLFVTFQLFLYVAINALLFGNIR